MTRDPGDEPDDERSLGDAFGPTQRDLARAAHAKPAMRRPGRPIKVQRWSGIERALRGEFGPLVAGVDEVGRGPLAGPVVACAVIMPPDVRAIRGVDDSKQLSREERERLARLIWARAVAVALGAASAREIDRLNIFQATVLAMRRALARLAITPHHVLVDGNPLRTLGVPHRAVVGGDARCYSVACASIVAKVTRDRLMRALGHRHPEYSWTQNVGYATAAHLAGIELHGISPHHRRRFWSVAQMLLPLGTLADVAPADGPDGIGHTGQDQLRG
jgi:ribonuclease HII